MEAFRLYKSVPPLISWAQRSDLLFVIIEAECKDIDYKVTENKFFFKGVDAFDNKKTYEVTLNFLHDVDAEKVTSKNIGRCLEFTIYKKENSPYWPSLTNDKTKLHFLKANFNKWDNESDSEDDNEKDRGDFFNSMNPSMDWNNKFDDFSAGDDDSDDNIPSLSQNDKDDDDEKKKDEKKDEKNEEKK